MISDRDVESYQKWFEEFPSKDATDIGAIANIQVGNDPEYVVDELVLRSAKDANGKFRINMTRMNSDWKWHTATFAETLDVARKVFVKDHKTDTLVLRPSPAALTFIPKTRSSAPNVVVIQKKPYVVPHDVFWFGIAATCILLLLLTIAIVILSVLLAKKRYRVPQSNEQNVTAADSALKIAET